ncbi:hypothetical protein Esti_006712 [Eimeria stiedai]
MWGTPAPAAPVSAVSSSKGAAAASAAAAAAGLRSFQTLATPASTAGSSASGSAAASAAGGAGAGAAAAAAGSEQTVLFRQQKTPLGFLLSKALETLKKCSGRPVHLKELERTLIQQGFGDLYPLLQASSPFMSFLTSAENVVFNLAQKTLLFQNPFASVKSAETLKAKVLLDGGLTGIRVDSDLLCTCPDAADFVQELLKDRSLRAAVATAAFAETKPVICMRRKSAAIARKTSKA